MTGVEPPDDPTIADDAVLLRRLYPRWLVSDGADGQRLSSNSFQDIADADSGVEGVSAHVESAVLAAGLSDETLLIGYEGHGVLSIRAADVRACGLGIVWAPSPREKGLSAAHVHILGPKPKSVQRKLANAATVRIYPADT